MGAVTLRKPEAFRQPLEPRNRNARGRGQAQTPRIHPVPRFIAIIAATAAVLLAAGCATSPASPAGGHVPAHVIVSNASRQLSHSTSLAITMDIQGPQGPAPQAPAIHADFTMRNAPDTAMTAAITEREADGTVFATIREILLNKVYYLSAKVFIPGAPQDLAPWAAPGKPWTAVPASKLNQASGNTQAPAADTSLALQNPMSLFGTIFAQISAAKDTSVAGGQVIDGVPTTRLHGTYRDHGAAAPFDLWVDAQDRPRELRLSSQGVTMTIHFRSFNLPVSITPPPAREVGPPKPGFGL